MEESKKFWFANIPYIFNKCFKDSLENFYKMGINGTTKENIQNSLDARLDFDKPVKVDIKIGEIETDLLPGYVELQEHIWSLEGGNQYTTDIIKHMQSSLNTTKVSYIAYEDSNTKGLNFEKADKHCSYYAYAYQQGNHCPEVNQLDEAMRGGSHGIGKIASNAISNIHLMYFCNCDKNNIKLIGGTVCLVEHSLRGQTYMDMGYLTRDIGNPYINDIDNKLFRKDTRGLKIIIPFLKDEFNKEIEIIKSICSDYFYAIIMNHLVVTVNDKVIDSSNIESYINDITYFDQDYEKMRKEFVVLNYKALVSQEPITINLKNKFMFQCYFYYDENIKHSRVSIVRRNGMKICDRKIVSYATKPFNALVISDNTESDNFLKILENQAHNDLVSKSIRDDNLRKKAESIIKELDKKIAAIYDEKNSKLYPPDGLIDTDDLLYTINSSFKDSLSKSTASVYLNVETKTKEITKINHGRNKKTHKQGNKKKKEPLKKIKRGTRSGGGNEVDALRYLIYPENIYRVTINNKEYFECDLSQVEDIEKYKKCNIVIKVIDGEGKKTNDFYKLDNYFIKIEDENTNKNLMMHHDIIRNIAIVDKKIKLNFYCSYNYNPLLKYIYYLEV